MSRQFEEHLYAIVQHMNAVPEADEDTEWLRKLTGVFFLLIYENRSDELADLIELHFPEYFQEEIDPATQFVHTSFRLN